MGSPLLTFLLMWAMLLGAGGMAWMWSSRLSPQARMRKRLDAISARMAVHDPASREAGNRRQLIQGKIKELEKQRRKDRKNQIRALIAQSGLSITLRDYIVGSLASALVAGLILWLVGMPKLALIMGVLGAGIGLPRWVLGFFIKRRRKAFTKNFADALDVLVRGTRTGLPVGECLRIVAREAPDPIGPEFAYLVESQRVGMTMKQALARSLERMPVAELQFFAVVLMIQQQTGGNLAATLENLSNILRARKKLRDKVTALSSEAKASAAIVGSLPFIVSLGLSVANPDYIALLFTERVGQVMIALSFIWMGMGIFVMRQMINFET